MKLKIFLILQWAKGVVLKMAFAVPVFHSRVSGFSLRDELNFSFWLVVTLRDSR